jgi:hypothetical protein
MSRKIDVDGPLSESDREYLHSRGQHALVERMDHEYQEPEPEDGGDGEPDTNYDAWTVKELQDECEERGIPKSGTKPELVARLREHDGQAL